MCSILGGTKFDDFALNIYLKAKDRGRDFTGLVQKGDSWIANHRATPTNENENPIQNQPFGKSFKIVHNGTIANDLELGNKVGDIDSKVLEDIIIPDNVKTVKESLKKVKGSFAIAILKNCGEIILACNYKPLFYIENNGEIYFSSLKRHLSPLALRVEPYSIISLKTKESELIDRYQPDKAIVVCSGGLDSTAITGFVNKEHQEMKLVHFSYGCKAEKKELEAIKKIANFYNCEYEILKIDYTKFKGDCTLFKGEKISSGIEGVEYALDWVYARNLVMLSISTAYAEANGFGYIYLGNNLEESGAYPDNEEQFIIDFNELLWGAVNNGYKIEVKSPLGGLMKKEIVDFGLKHNSPIEMSWSCYNNEEKHCGVCGPCFMRKKAFERSKKTDLTIYKK